MKTTRILLGLFILAALGCNNDDNEPLFPADPETQVPAEQLAPLDAQIEVKSGKLSGQADADTATWEWLGIPFAQPPVDALRWRAPLAEQSWEGVRNATGFPDACPQFDRSGTVIGAEDCLYLNVWRPQTQQRDLPVYVWIHGGSNTSGSIDVNYYQGGTIAERSNMVVVSIQYRLGALGWLHYAPLQNGNANDDSGNYGTLDIIRSLQWIKDNIASFGGDPANVTVTGESAGAFNIISLLMAEQASGLFEKAVIQSGLPITATVAEGEAAAAQLTDNVLANDGVAADTLSDAETAEYLRSKSAADILTAAPQLPFIFADGKVIPSNGTAALFDGSYANKVPLIIGTNRDEYKLWTAFLNPLPAEKADLSAALGRYASDLWRVAGADSLATAFSQNSDQPAIYVYRFNWGSPNADGVSPLPAPFDQSLGAHHALEIPFVLGNIEFWLDPALGATIFNADNRESRVNLSAAMVEYWGNFARSGDPNGADLATWPVWSNTEGAAKAIVFDTNPVDQSALIGEDTQAWTFTSVRADIDANVAEPLRTELLTELQSLGWLTGTPSGSSIANKSDPEDY